MVFSHDLSHGLFSWSFFIVFIMEQDQCQYDCIDGLIIIVFSHRLFLWSLYMVFLHCLFFSSFFLLGMHVMSFYFYGKGYTGPTLANRCGQRPCHKKTAKTMRKDHEKRP